MADPNDEPFDLRRHWLESAALDLDYRRPGEVAALAQLKGARDQLLALGWQDIAYYPKDGTRFLVVEAGTTRPHVCRYSGEWPRGSWFIEEAGDAWPSRPILWRPLPESPDEKGGEHDAG